MDKGEVDTSQETIGSVKQAVNFYAGKQDRRRLQIPLSEKPSLRARELHMVKRNISQVNENRRVADSIRSQAELDLLNAKKTVKDLTLQLEETKSRTQTTKQELGTFIRSDRLEDERALVVAEEDKHQYTQVMRELEYVKQELSKLKLDMAYLLERKSQADRETEASTSRMRSYSNSIEGLRAEIEETNEEQVLVELAKIEAMREFEVIEAQREAEAAQFASTMENTQNKMKEILHEIDRSKDLQAKLAITTSDVDVLQSELNLIKTMGESFNKNENIEEAGQVTDELEAAKKELAGIKEEGFQFMASMDIIRNELKHVTEENARLKNLEKKAESTVQNLNFKLLRAKSKLESVSTAEENAKAIASSLSATLEQLTTEAEAAKKENLIITETTEKIRLEKQKIETEIDTAEERLRVVAKQLEEAKVAEALALENLKNVSEKTMKDRASASSHMSTITISSFEYKYLKGRAEGIEEIADKKVAAAQAWIEAIKANEKEILMKTEMALREVRETNGTNEQQDDEPTLVRQQHERSRKSVTLQVDEGLARKPIKEYYATPAPVRRGGQRRPGSPGGRHVNRTGSITLKRRAKVMPKLGDIFGSKMNSENL